MMLEEQAFAQVFEALRSANDNGMGDWGLVVALVAALYRWVARPALTNLSVIAGAVPAIKTQLDELTEHVAAVKEGVTNHLPTAIRENGHMTLEHMEQLAGQLREAVHEQGDKTRSAVGETGKAIENCKVMLTRIEERTQR